MKIRNLYIGNIKVVTERTFFKYEGPFIEWYMVFSSLKRTTVLEKKEKANKVRDIIYGGSYRLNRRLGSEVGEEFAEIVYPVTQDDKFSNYKKENISKIKVKKIFENN